MSKLSRRAWWAAMATVVASGCGLAFQAGTRYREHRMLDHLQPGQTMSEIRGRWGEPDIVERRTDSTEIWSYAARPNTDDPVAFTVYTSAKAGDSGTFLDLTMVDGRLVSWAESRHTLPAKERGRIGFGGIGNANPPSTSHY